MANNRRKSDPYLWPDQYPSQTTYHQQGASHTPTAPPHQTVKHQHGTSLGAYSQYLQPGQYQNQGTLYAPADHNQPTYVMVYSGPAERYNRGMHYPRRGMYPAADLQYSQPTSLHGGYAPPEKKVAFALTEKQRRGERGRVWNKTGPGPGDNKTMAPVQHPTYEDTDASLPVSSSGVSSLHGQELRQIPHDHQTLPRSYGGGHPPSAPDAGREVPRNNGNPDPQSNPSGHLRKGEKRRIYNIRDYIVPTQEMPASAAERRAEEAMADAPNNMLGLSGLS